MSLTLIGTPIGNKDDITLRALKALKETDYIIGEELKTLRRRLSDWDVAFREKTLLNLNEHTDEARLLELLDCCTENDVCLVTDCGTPSFFDPGFSLVSLCRKQNVAVKSLPGVSSLTALMPYLPKKTEKFNVLGFPPQKEHDRKDFFNSIREEKNPLFIMDTPYRLQKTLSDIQNSFPKGSMVLGVNLTCDSELIVQGDIDKCIKSVSHLKKENFVLMVYPRGF